MSPDTTVIDANSDAMMASSERINIRVPQNPHMEQAQIDYFEELLRNSRCLLEYGAGGSTLLAARCNVPDIVSIDSDSRFVRSVTRAFRRTETTSRLTIRAVKIGPTGKWGIPIDRSHSTRWPDYTLDVWNVVREAGLNPDVILIDGRFRVACFYATMMQAHPGAKILFDDYTREKRGYSVVEQFAKPVQVIERMAVFEVPENRDMVALGFGLARYVVQHA